jgi:hypothetical protein
LSRNLDKNPFTLETTQYYTVREVAAMRKALPAAALTLALLFSAVTGTQLVNSRRANPIYFEGRTPPLKVLNRLQSQSFLQRIITYSPPPIFL